MRAKRLLINQGAQTPFTLLVTPETTVHMREENMPPQYGESINVPSSEQKMSSELLKNGQELTRLKDGTEVIEIKDIRVTDNAVPYQPFTTQSIIGEFFVLDWSPYANSNLNNGCRYGNQNLHYCSDQRTILIHDMELDVLAKITLEQCIRNGGSKESGFPDMDILGQIYNNNKDKWKGKQADKYFYPDRKNHATNANDRHGTRRTAHMMFFMNRGVPRLVRHVGNFDDNVVSPNIKKQMGQTLVHMANLNKQDLKAADDFMHLMRELETAGPDKEYEEKATESAQIVSEYPSEQSEGEEEYDEEANKKTLEFLLKTKDLTLKNKRFTIPSSSGDLPSVPPFIASFLGLQALARLKADNYDGLAKRAKAVVTLVQKLFNSWKIALKSDFLQKTEDEEIYTDIEVFFMNVIYMYRVPLVENRESPLYNRIFDDEISADDLILSRGMVCTPGLNLEVTEEKP